MRHAAADGTAATVVRQQFVRLGEKRGDFVAVASGLKPGEVVVADTLTILLAKLIGGALELRPDRHVILTDVANFHSDLYVVEAVASRPTGPAATVASAPSLNLSPSRCCSAWSFMKSRTRSVEEPPIW